MKQISGQTILSSPQDLEFNPNFAKNRDIPGVNIFSTVILASHSFLQYVAFIDVVVRLS